MALVPRSSAGAVRCCASFRKQSRIGFVGRSADNPAVARREFQSLRELLPSVLARLAEDTGRARQLRPLWEDAVGPAIARAATPHALEGSTLVLSVSTARWATELSQREPELLARMREKLGKPLVTKLVFRLNG